MFYKLIDEETKNYTFGPYVHSADYFLDISLKDTYQLPIDGWHWFDSEAEAKTFFGIADVLPPSE